MAKITVINTRANRASIGGKTIFPGSSTTVDASFRNAAQTHPFLIIAGEEEKSLTKKTETKEPSKETEKEAEKKKGFFGSEKKK